MQANSCDIHPVFLKEHVHPQFSEITALNGNPHLIFGQKQMQTIKHSLSEQSYLWKLALELRVFFSYYRQEENLI